MNWLRIFIIYILEKFNNWLKKRKLITENIHISWSDFISTDKASIILYKANNCKLCDEIELFLKNKNISYKAVVCKVYIPYRISNQQQLTGYLGFRGRHLKETNQIFLPPIFPQMDFVDSGGKWNRIVGDVEAMRKLLTEFIDKNLDTFPGFETGINQDKSPADQAVTQIQNIMRKVE